MSYYLRKDITEEEIQRQLDEEDLLARLPPEEPLSSVDQSLTQAQWNLEEERAKAKNQVEYDAMMTEILRKGLPKYVSPAARSFVPPDNIEKERKRVVKQIADKIDQGIIDDLVLRTHPREQPPVSFDQLSSKEKDILVVSHKLDALTFEAYQACAEKTAIYNKDARVFYPALGLTGEVGEFIEKVLQMSAHAGKVANQVKKIIRDDDSECNVSRMDEIAKELGGVLWYLSAIATDLGLDLGVIAQENLDILASRQKRGVIQGDGDDR